MTTSQPTRAGAVRQPLPAARARAVFDPRAAGRARRRKLALRLIPAMLLVILVVVELARLIGSGTPAPPSQVAREIHDDVTRGVISRTDDFTAAVGPLDCVELHPGQGNCLADVTLAGHQSDRVMVAVTYTDEGGDYALVIKMP